MPYSYTSNVSARVKLPMLCVPLLLIVYTGLGPDLMFATGVRRTFYSNAGCGFESPLLLKEGKARSAGVVLKESRSAPAKKRFARISGGFASLENHPDSLREPPLLQKEGSCLTADAAGLANFRSRNYFG